ncbi:hypothetical protein BDW66DRAFT_93106 [Aspergillus desertorum]
MSYSSKHPACGYACMWVWIAAFSQHRPSTVVRCARAQRDAECHSLSICQGRFDGLVLSTCPMISKLTALQLRWWLLYLTASHLSLLAKC